MINSSQIKSLASDVRNTDRLGSPRALLRLKMTKGPTEKDLLMELKLIPVLSRRAQFPLNPLLKILLW